MYLFEQIFQYLNEHYFSASLGSYDNFEIESVTALVVIIGGLCLGMFLASVATVVQKKHVGKMARTLLSLEADSKEKAKTLGELGLSKNALIKMSLSSPSVLRKMLSIVEGDEVFTYLDELGHAYPEYKEEIEKKREELQKSAADKKEEQSDGGALAEESPFQKENSKKEKKSSLFKRRFRLKKLNFDEARFFIAPEMKERAYFRFKEKGNSWWIVLISFVALTVLFFLSLRLLPVLVSMLDATISNFRGL